MTIIVKCFYQGKETLIGEGNVITGSGIQGPNLARALPHGRFELHEFGGVVDHSAPCKGAQKVKICFMTGFQWSLTERTIEIPSNSFTLGYLINDKLYIGIKDNSPMYWPIP